MNKKADEVIQAEETVLISAPVNMKWAEFKMVGTQG